MKTTILTTDDFGGSKDSGVTEGARRATVVTPESLANGIQPDPEVSDKPTRRRV